MHCAVAQLKDSVRERGQRVVQGITRLEKVLAPTSTSCWPLVAPASPGAHLPH